MFIIIFIKINEHVSLPISFLLVKPAMKAYSFVSPLPYNSPQYIFLMGERNMFSFRRMSHNKSSLFSTLSFAAFLFIILLSVSIFCSLSLHRVVLTYPEKHVEITPSNKVQRRLKSNVLLSVKEEIKEDFVECMDPLIPPFNVTEEERIAWFKGKLSEFDIFHSTELSHQFAQRTKEFFNSRCEVQFFMTWISPAKLFRQREFLALESLFNSHPAGCLMILSRTMDTRQGNQILRPLSQRGFKVVAITPDLPFLLKGTPAEAWFDEVKKGNRDPGEIPLAQNLSNLLRLAVLYKYGGIYLDTDFIVLKKLSTLRNTIGAQSMDPEYKNWTRLNNAVLIFDKNHPLIYKFIEEFAITFDGNKWGHNGPYLVSRVVDRLKERPGYNFTILPPMAFYPVDWTRIGGFFSQPKNLANAKWIAAKLLQLRGETFGVHLWNKQSTKLGIEEGSIIGKLISNHCILCRELYSS